MAAALARGDHLVALEKRKAVAEQDEERFHDRFVKIQRDAIQMSQVRHDSAISANPDQGIQASAARAERRDVDSLIEIGANEQNAIDREADLYAGIYGDDSVRTLRSDLQNLRQSQEQALRLWDRAAGDVDDAYTAAKNGTDTDLNSSDVDHFYAESETKMAEAKKYDDMVQGDLTPLIDRFLADLQRVQKDVDAAKADDR